MRPPAFRPLLAVLGGMLLAACSEPQPRRQPSPRPSDKAALYADAALVPTRTGERARAEVAWAEEIRVALETLHRVDAARVTVSTGRDGSPDSAAIVIRARAGDPDALRSSAQRIALAALGSNEVELAIEISEPDADVPAQDLPARPLPLVLFAVFGLGISIGLTFDRARRLVRRRT